jgi:hypothetical protein
VITMARVKRGLVGSPRIWAGEKETLSSSPAI